MSDNVISPELLAAMKKKEEIVPTIIIRVIDRAIQVEVVEDRGLFIGKLEQALPVIVREIEKVRAKRRNEDRRNEIQMKLDKDIEREAEEREAMVEQKSDDLPKSDLSQPATLQ